MLEDAIKKLRSEMDKNISNPYIQVIGSFLLQHVEANPEAAGKISNSDKTIGKSLDEMKKAAEKKKVGNCAVLTDQEGFAIVLKYYGIEAGAKRPAELEKTEPPKTTTEQKSAIDFDIRLEDLI